MGVAYLTNDPKNETGKGDHRKMTAMVYVVKFRPKGDSKNPRPRFARTLFAECDGKPSREKAATLLNNITGGDFLEDTIQIQELRAFDPAEVRSQGATVFSL